jgi:hypothetical protein
MKHVQGREDELQTAVQELATEEKQGEEPAQQALKDDDVSEEPGDQHNGSRKSKPEALERLKSLYSQCKDELESVLVSIDHLTVLGFPVDLPSNESQAFVSTAHLPTSRPQNAQQCTKDRARKPEFPMKTDEIEEGEIEDESSGETPGESSAVAAGASTVTVEDETRKRNGEATREEGEISGDDTDIDTREPLAKRNRLGDDQVFARMP